jgi:hypothetical protein
LAQAQGHVRFSKKIAISQNYATGSKHSPLLDIHKQYFSPLRDAAGATGLGFEKYILCQQRWQAQMVLASGQVFSSFI